MNLRSIEILLFLIDKEDSIALTDLSQKYNVSERSIYTSINEINDFLSQHGQKPLQTDDGKIEVRVNYNNEFEYLEIRKHLLQELSRARKYDPNYRIRFIIFLLIKHGKLNSKELADTLLISISTIKSDMNKVRIFLSTHELKLDSIKFEGYQIKGKESDKRNILTEIILDDFKVRHFDEIDLYFQKSIDKNLFSKAKYIIDKFSELKKTQYVDKHYIYLVISAFISILRISKNNTLEKDYSEYNDLNIYAEDIKILKHFIKKEYPLSDNEFKNELVFLCKRIQRASYFDGSESVLYSRDILSLHLLVNKLIKNIANDVKGIDPNDSRLFEELVQHLKPSINRMKRNIQYENPLKEEVKQNYFEIFQTVNKNINLVENYYSVIFTDHEISYITLIFASAYERNNKDKSYSPKVIIVCQEGISTSSLLETQLKNLFSIDVVATYSVNKFNKVKKDLTYDFIISTIDLPDNLNYLKVNPILTSVEKVQLSTIFNKAPEDYDLENIFNSFLSKSKSYMKILNYEGLKEVFIQFFKNPRNETIRIKHEKEGRELMLNDVISQDLIETNVTVDTPHEAINYVGNLLKGQDLIKQSYIDEMLESFEKNGPYFVIAPGIAMPHARPEAGVRGVGISLITLQKPIKFNHIENDPVKLIIGLCAVDNQSHLNALSNLMEILSDEDKLEKIKNSESSGEILDILSKGVN